MQKENDSENAKKQEQGRELPQPVHACARLR
jgi:hypothetical protein